MYGIPDSKLAKLDKEQFEKDWRDSLKARLNAQQRASDMAFDFWAVPVMCNLGIGMPCEGCSMGGGFGLFI